MNTYLKLPQEEFHDEREHEIEFITGKVIEEIEQDHVVFRGGFTLPSALTILIPTYRGPDLITESGLGDEAGFVPTDESFQHLDYENIFAIGDVASRTVPNCIMNMGHRKATLIRSNTLWGGDMDIAYHSTVA